MLLNWYSSMKKMRKTWMIYDIENWLWKSNFGIFESSTLIQNSKFNHFLWLCWFLCKNLVPPAWKLYNPYCHIAYLYSPHSPDSFIWHLRVYVHLTNKYVWKVNPSITIGTTCVSVTKYVLHKVEKAFA